MIAGSRMSLETSCESGINHLFGLTRRLSGRNKNKCAQVGVFTGGK
jgi:hypothetical protein